MLIREGLFLRAHRLTNHKAPKAFLNKGLAMHPSIRRFWSYSELLIILASVAFAALLALPAQAVDQKSTAATISSPQASEASKPVEPQPEATQSPAVQSTIPPTSPVAPNASTTDQSVIPAASTTPFTLEGADLGRMLRRTTTALPIRNRDGSMKLDLQGGYRNVLVVRIGADGKPEISCIASEEQARAVFAPVQKAAPDATTTTQDPATEVKKDARPKERP